MVHVASDGPFWAHGVFWVAVAFVLFFVIFGRKLWLVLADMLDRRAAAIRTELDEAARLRREAEQMVAEARAHRERALAEATEMLARARREAQRLAEATREEAEEAARRREHSALDRIAAAEKAAVSEVRLSAADVAVKAASRVLREDHAEEQDAPLRARAIGALAAALAPRRVA